MSREELRELARRSWGHEEVALGTATDPYQPAEKSHRVMRSILEALSRANHPVGIVTKSALILRDLDILPPDGTPPWRTLTLN